MVRGGVEVSSIISTLTCSYLADTTGIPDNPRQANRLVFRATKNVLVEVFEETLKI